MNQVKNNTKEWFSAAAIRAIKTMAQVLISFIGVGAALSDINWMYALSVTIVAGILSILTSITGLPEANTLGTLVVDKTGKTDKYSINLGENLETIEDNKTVMLKIENVADIKEAKKVAVIEEKKEDE